MVDGRFPLPLPFRRCPVTTVTVSIITVKIPVSRCFHMFHGFLVRGLLTPCDALFSRLQTYRTCSSLSLSPIYIPEQNITGMRGGGGAKLWKLDKPEFPPSKSPPQGLVYLIPLHWAPTASLTCGSTINVDFPAPHCVHLFLIPAKDGLSSLCCPHTPALRAAPSTDMINTVFFVAPPHVKGSKHLSMM